MPVLSILYMLSNRWWTGSAEPALTLVRGLLDHGHRVVLGVPSGSQVEEPARQAGIPLIRGLRLNPHVRPWAWLQDLRRLNTVLRRAPIDVLHTHLSHDHWLGTIALTVLNQTRQRQPVHVRTIHTLRRRDSRLNRWLFQHGADHLITVSPPLQQDLMNAYHIAASHVTVIPGAVDSQRFHPHIGGNRVREEFE